MKVVAASFIEEERGCLITKMAHTSDNPISASTMSGLTMMFTEAEELFAATVKMFPSYLLSLRLVPS